MLVGSTAGTTTAIKVNRTANRYRWPTSPCEARRGKAAAVRALKAQQAHRAEDLAVDVQHFMREILQEVVERLVRPSARLPHVEQN